MASLIQRRPPRAFSGERASGLRELYSATQGCLGILSVTKIAEPGERYNTTATVLIKDKTLNHNQEIKTVFYNRITLARVFALANTVTNEGYKLEIGSQYTHPIASTEIIKILNGKYRCDFQEEDLHITYINGNFYSLESKVNSLGYLGKITLAIGIEEDIPLTPTENALFEADKIIVNNTLTTNGRTYGFDDPAIFSTENVITKHFVKKDGTHLNYFLNLNEVSVQAETRVDISSRPASANLNETVRPSNGKFVLAAFIPAVVEPNVEPLTASKTISFTSWLDSLEKIDAVFEFKINGTRTTLKSIKAGVSNVSLTYVDGVVTLTNKTYNKLDLYIRAKTVSLPAFEDPAFTFLTFNDTHALMGGYEVYGYQLEALVKPLENFVVEHCLPTQAIYNSLLTRLNQTVGVPPKVSVSGGVITDIQSLNPYHDSYDTYAESLVIGGNTKVFNASIAKNGLSFLDVFAISKEHWEILQKADMNQNVLTITRSNQNVVESNTNYTYNQLLARGVWDAETERFIFAFLGKDDWEGTTRFVYSSNALFLPTNLVLTTTRDISSTYYPKATLIDDALWARMVAVKPAWLTQYGRPVVAGTHPEVMGSEVIGVGVSSTFKLNLGVTPTPAEITAKSVGFKHMVGIAFSDNIKPILDRALASNNVIDPNAVIFRTTSSNGQLNASAITFTVGNYQQNEFADFYHDVETGRYIRPLILSGNVDLSGYDYNNITRPETPTTSKQYPVAVRFDADTLYGAVFRSGDSTLNVQVDAYLSAPALKSPTVRFIEGQMDFITGQPATMEILWTKALGVTTPPANTFGETDHLYKRQTTTAIEVNVKRFGNTRIHAAVVELVMTDETAANLNNASVISIQRTINGVVSNETINGTELKNRFTKIGTRWLALWVLTATNTTQGQYVYNIDVDAGNAYLPEISTLTTAVNVIEPPMSLFALVDQDADNNSQATLLNHEVPTGAPAVTVPEASPFELYQAPKHAIVDLSFTDNNSKVTVDGRLEGVDEKTVVGIEFKLFLNPEDLNAKPDDSTVVGRLTKSGTQHSIDLTYAVFKRQTYLKGDELYLYLLVKVTQALAFNGDYVLEVDWDGLGTDDNYILNGVDHNSYYKQTINFALDLNAVFLPRDLESPRLYWGTAAIQKDLYQRVVNGNVSYPASGLIDPLFVEYGLVNDTTAVNIIKPVNTGSLNVVLFAQTNLTDATFAMLDAARIQLQHDGIYTDLDVNTFKAQLVKYQGVYYFGRTYKVEDTDDDISYVIDLDSDDKTYKATTSPLKAGISVQPQVFSPTFNFALDQRTLVEAVQNNQVVVAGLNPAGMIVSDRIDYGAVSGLQLNAEVIRGVDATLWVFLEFLGKEEELAAFNDRTTYSVYRNNNLVESLNQQQLLSKLFTWNGKHYIALPYAQNAAGDDFEIRLNTDPSNLRYAQSRTALKASFTWVSQIGSPVFIIPNNQIELFNAYRDGLFSITDVNLTGFTLAEPAGLTYNKVAADQLNVGYVANTNDHVVLSFLELDVTAETLELFSANSTVRLVKNGSEQNLTWTNFATRLVSYNGKYYYPVYELNEDNYDHRYSITINIDPTNPLYTPATSDLRVGVSLTRAVTSPKFIQAPIQQALYNAFLAGAITIPGLTVQEAVPAERLTYTAINDSLVQMSTVVNATDNYWFPVFHQLVITSEMYAKLDVSSTVQVKNNTTGQTDNINGLVLKASMVNYQGNYYLVSKTNKLDTTIDLDISVDVDGSGRYYEPTVSNLRIESTWKAPLASPNFTLAQNQRELITALNAGQINLTADKAFVDAADVTYANLDLDSVVANVQYIGEERILPIFWKFSIDDAQFAALSAQGQIQITDQYSGSLAGFASRLVKFAGSYYFATVDTVVTNTTEVRNKTYTYQLDWDGTGFNYIPSQGSIDTQLIVTPQQLSPSFTLALNMLEVNDDWNQGTFEGTTTTLPGVTPAKVIPSSLVEMLTLNESAAELWISQKTPEQNTFILTLDTVLTDDDVMRLDADTTFSVRYATGTDYILTGFELQSRLYKYLGVYRFSIPLTRDMVSQVKGITLAIDIDGPGAEFLPATSVVGVDIVWNDLVRCDGVPNATQFVNLTGNFKVRVDGRFVDAGRAMSMDEIETYFDTHEHGIIVDRIVDISCVGSPNTTQYFSLDGRFDILVENDPVVINAEQQEIIDALIGMGLTVDTVTDE